MDVSLFLQRALDQGDTALFADCSLEKQTSLLTEGDMPCEEFAQLFQPGLLLLDIGLAAFPKWASMEEEIAKEVAKRLSRRTQPLTFESERLNPEQHEAVTKALSSSLFFLTGGPGTGKTYTAGVYIKQRMALKKGLFRTYLLAPTGKAMKTLEKSIHRAVKEEPQLQLQAMTIHAFLLQQKRKSPLVADAVLVDESSMIDTKLMYDLFKAIDTKTPLLFLGDADQLPPIEPGQPFCDIVEALESAQAPFVQRLRVCERTDSKAIVELAQTILQGGIINGALSQKEIQFVSLDSGISWKQAEELWLKEVFLPWKRVSSLSEAQDLLQRRVLLTADKRGSFGSSLLTQRAETLLSLHESLYSPLLSTKNAYDLGVMNGELGVLANGVVHFVDHSFPRVLLERSESAYALTVHKSQGSEFQEVHILVPPKATLSRQMLYTAVTRARQKVVLYGTTSSLQSAIACQERRMTSLPFFMRRELSNSNR